MRIVIASALAACLVLMASAMMAPQNQFAPALSAGPASEGMPVQSVNRTNKSDRLAISSSEQESARSKPHKMLTGCDPAFSPLAISAKANFPRRCAA